MGPSIGAIVRIILPMKYTDDGAELAQRVLKRQCMMVGRDYSWDGIIIIDETKRIEASLQDHVQSSVEPSVFVT